MTREVMLNLFQHPLNTVMQNLFQHPLDTVMQNLFQHPLSPVMLNSFQHLSYREIPGQARNDGGGRF